MNDLPPHVLFYDGVCAMCNGIVKTMIRLDREGIFHYAPLQGETAARARTERVRRLQPMQMIPGMGTPIEAAVWGSGIGPPS